MPYEEWIAYEEGLLLGYMGAILLHLAQGMPICNKLDILKWISTWLEHIYVGIAEKGRRINLNFGPFCTPQWQIFPCKTWFLPAF